MCLGEINLVLNGELELTWEKNVDCFLDIKWFYFVVVVNTVTSFICFVSMNPNAGMHICLLLLV